MSATNRGAERLDKDNYPTPDWCVHRLLERYELPGGEWLEPCVGEGAIVRAVLKVRNDVSFTGYDVRNVINPAVEAGVSHFKRISYLAEPPRSRSPSVIITNPPFSLALEIARKATQEARFTALLLRLNILGSGKKNGRSKWLREWMPDVCALPDRPEFVCSLKCKTDGCGWKSLQPLEDYRPKFCPQCAGFVQCSTTDATEYAWFVWDRKNLGSEGRIMLLNETSPEERRVVPLPTALLQDEE